DGRGLILMLGARIAVLLLLTAVVACGARALRLRKSRSPEGRWSAVLLAGTLAPVVVFSVFPVESVPPYQLPALVPGAAAAGLLIRRVLAGAKDRARIRRAVLLPGVAWIIGFGILRTAWGVEWLRSATF